MVVCLVEQNFTPALVAWKDDDVVFTESLRPLFFSMLILDSGGFALLRHANTFICSCFASMSAVLLFLIADSVAVISFSSGICFSVTTKYNPLQEHSSLVFVSCLAFDILLFAGCRG